MSDEALRSAERAASSSGDVEAAARLLTERMRSGELAPRQVRLAAYADDPAAALAIDGRAVDPAEPSIDPTSPYGEVVRGCLHRRYVPPFEELLWLRGLVRWGVEALTRGVVEWIIARHRRVPTRLDDRPGRFVAMLERWLARPSPETVRALEVNASLAATGMLPTATSFIRLSSNAATWDPDELRRHLLQSLEMELGRHGATYGADDLRAAARRIAAWALSGPRSLDDDRPEELVPGTSLRRRVVETHTSAQRIGHLEALRRSKDAEVTLVLVDGERGRFSVGGVSLEEVQGEFQPPDGRFSVPLDRIAEVHAGSRIPPP